MGVLPLVSKGVGLPQVFLQRFHSIGINGIASDLVKDANGEFDLLSKEVVKFYIYCFIQKPFSSNYQILHEHFALIYVKALLN